MLWGTEAVLLDVGNEIAELIDEEADYPKYAELEQNQGLLGCSPILRIGRIRIGVPFYQNSAINGCCYRSVGDVLWLHLAVGTRKFVFLASRSKISILAVMH